MKDEFFDNDEWWMMNVVTEQFDKSYLELAEVMS